MSMLPRYYPEVGTDDKYLPIGFEDLPKPLITHPIMVTIRHMTLLREGYEDYMAKDKDAPKVTALCSVGTRLVYDTLGYETEFSLGTPEPSPPETHIKKEHDVESDVLNAALYTVIRYTSMIYLNQVLWPTPRPSGIAAKLAAVMLDAIEDLRRANGWTKYPELSAWAAVMGAIVGLGEVRSQLLLKCLKCLDIISAQNQVDETSSWARLLRVSRTFLWYEGPETFLQQNLEDVQIEFAKLRTY